MNKLLRKQLLNDQSLAQADLMRQLAAYKQHLNTFGEEHGLNQLPLPNKVMYADNTPVGTPQEEMSKLKSQLTDFVAKGREAVGSQPEQIAEVDEENLPKFNRLRSLVKPI